MQAMTAGTDRKEARSLTPRGNTMNRYLTASILAIAAASTSVAFADDITVVTHPFTGSLTRAEVQSQLQQYKAAGVNPWSTSYNPLARLQSNRTRADVTADYLRSRNEVAALNAEDSGSALLAAQARRYAAPVMVGEVQPAR
jgi:hypothetical protein